MSPRKLIVAQVIQILPKVFKERTFGEQNEEPTEDKASNLIVSNHVQKILSDNELLKKQVAQLESTLQEVHKESDTFGEKLFNMKVNGVVDNPEETIQLLAQEFLEMKKKQDDMKQLLSGINLHEQTLNIRVEELTNKFNTWVNTNQEEEEGAL